MPRQEKTKEIFLEVALKLFCEKGYDTVTLSEIAKEVGCVPSALYRHYENKQKLYEAILATSTENYENKIRILHSYDNITDCIDKYVNQTVDEQVKEVQQLFKTAFVNDNAKNFRKLMMTEQFKKTELGEMYEQRYLYAHIAQFQKLFTVLIENGIMREVDAETAAITFCSPMANLIAICDRDESKMEYALDIIDKHVREFNRVYRIEK